MKPRYLAAAVAVTVIAAACGGGGSHKVATRKGTTTTHRATTTTDASTTSAAPGTTGATGATTTTAKRASTTTGGHAATSTTTGTPVVTDQVKATQMASLSQPIALALRPGEANNVYIAQKGGVVKRLVVAGNSASVNGDVLNVSGRLSTQTEQGLLGIAFGPGGNTLYADYTDTNGDTVIAAYPYSAVTGVAASNNEHVIIKVPHPNFGNHNGGNIVFGPDGYLYAGLGDGGNAGDPPNNAQNLGVLNGKMIRIAPNPNGGYSIPADNPFVHTQGARGEIDHYGLRNPWRWSFDRATGEQWIGDVGQDAYEEIDHIGVGVKGVNFGWNKREGNHPYNGGATPTGAVDPVIEVPHSPGGNCAIVGGYVYRGSAIRGFAGTYLFTDDCNGQIVAFVNGATRNLGVNIAQPSSFGEDASGELWVLSLNGPVYRFTRQS